MTQETYKYKVKECNSLDDIDQAIFHYTGVLKDNPGLPKSDINNINNNLTLLFVKKMSFESSTATGPQPIEAIEPIVLPRHIAVIKILELIPFLFDHSQKSKNWDFIKKMFAIYLGQLKVDDEPWTPSDFSEIIYFPNCNSKEDRIIYMIYNLITNGLRTPSYVRLQINMLVKIIRILELEKQVSGITLPVNKLRTHSVESLQIQL